MSKRAIVVFRNAAVGHAVGAKPTVSSLNLRIEPEDAWVITGPLGSGKTTILDAIRGEKSVDRRALEHPFLDKAVWPSEVIRILRSKVTITGNSAYYSERYHSRREDDYSLFEWLASDLPPSSVDRDAIVAEAAEKLGLSEYLQSSTMNLSNGQTKRAAIAKILLTNPKVLLLDEPYVGLDKGARESLDRVLGALVASGTTNIILALRPRDHVPAWTTHLLWLDQTGATRHAGPRAEIAAAFEAERAVSGARVSVQQASHTTSPTGPVLVDLQHVSVSYWDKPVLTDIDWTIRAGEKWHLAGSNGSGKTTLLAMILGDHPKIYANKVFLFGRRRTVGDGRSIFQLQAEMGHTSPELHRHFPKYGTAAQCIASAFGETFVAPKHITSAQQGMIDHIVAYFGVREYLNHTFSDLSPAMQRLCLLLRALVKSPKLVVLDEPFAGLDEALTIKAKSYIDHEIGPHQAVLFVTHYEDEIPASVRRTLRLDKGRVVQCT